MSRTLHAIAAEVDVPTKLSPQLRGALLAPLANYGAAAKLRPHAANAVRERLRKMCRK